MANQVPEIFRPSHAVKIALRFEEYDDTGELRARLPVLAPGAIPVASPQIPDASSLPVVQMVPQDADQLSTLAGKVDDELTAAIQAQEDGDETQGDYISALAIAGQEIDDRLAAIGAEDAEQQALDYAAGPTPDDRVINVQLVPRSTSIERNALRTADTASVTVDYRDLPTDARLVRCAAIEIVIGVVDPRDWERGIAGEHRQDESGALFSYVQANSPNATRFVGVVDNWKTVYDGEDGEVVEIECRDYSALLIDTPLATGTAIDLNLPLDQGIQAFLRLYPTLRDVKVFYGRPGDTGTAPTPATACPQSTRPRRGRGTRHRRSGDQRMNLWDMVTDVCTRVGLVPVFYDYDLRLLDPRTFYSDRDTPKRMVYGRNLKHLEFSRRLGGVKVPTIEVRCYDPDICRTRWARYPVPDGADATQSAGIFGVNDPPTRPTRANETSVSGWAPDERIQTYVVYDVTDPDMLRRVARSYFEQIGRQEIDGNFATDLPRSVSPSEVRSRGEPAKAVALDAMDMLNLTSGDPVELLVAGSRGVAPDQLANLSAVELQAMTTQRRAEYLESIGWQPQVAQRFARLAEAVAFQTVFRTQNVRIEMDNDEGLRLTVDYINYITVREEAQSRTDAGEAATVTTQTIALGPVIQLDEFRITESTDAARDRITQLRSDGVIDDATYTRQMQELDDQDETAIATQDEAEGGAGGVG